MLVTELQRGTLAPPCPIIGGVSACTRQWRTAFLTLTKVTSDHGHQFTLPQEREHLRLAVARIATATPDVLLVELSVARSAQEELLARGISLVLNVKPELQARALMWEPSTARGALLRAAAHIVVALPSTGPCCLPSHQLTQTLSLPFLPRHTVTTRRSAWHARWARWCYLTWRSCQRQQWAPAGSSVSRCCRLRLLQLHLLHQRRQLRARPLQLALRPPAARAR